MSLHNFHRGYYRSRWEMLHWKETEGSSYLSLLNEMSSTQVAWKKIKDDMQDWMLQEQFLRVLHPEFKSYVILQDPKTAKEAATIADQFHMHTPHLPYLRPAQQPSGPQWPRRRDERGPGRRSGDRPGERAPYQNREENKPGRSTEAHNEQLSHASPSRPNPPQCWICKAEGHIQKYCPNRRECNVLSKEEDAPPKRVFPGTIFGHHVKNIFIDSGSSQSMVALNGCRLTSWCKEKCSPKDPSPTAP